MKLSLRNYLVYLNKQGKDVDVTVDGLDFIAYCPGYTLTDAGKEYFEKALDKCYVEVYEHIPDDIVMYDGDETDDEEGIPECAYLAWELFVSIGGWCTLENHKRWFTDEAEILPANTIKCTVCGEDIDVDNDTYYKLYDTQYCTNCMTVING